MATRILNVLLRIALLAAIVSSTVLYIDYQSSAAATFCDAASDCAKVRASPFSHIGPISMPMIGLFVFSALFVFALFARQKGHLRILTIQTGLVAAGALGLIALQLFWIKATCRWCMIVDVGALVAFASAMSLVRREPDPEPTPLRFLWGIAAAAAVAVPMLWDYSAAANEVRVPKSISKHFVEGKVNMVMFTDFECPHCRKLHGALDDEIERLGERAHLVRVMVPLEMHPGAKPAALAYLCTPDAQREAMAQRLYEASGDELTDKGVVEIAEELGLAGQELAACMASDETKKRLDNEREIFLGASLQGVPSTFVNDELVRGADPVALKSAVDRALGGDGGGTDVVWMFVFLGVVVGAVAAISVVAAARGESEVPT